MKHVTMLQFATSFCSKLRATPFHIHAYIQSYTSGGPSHRRCCLDFRLEIAKGCRLIEINILSTSKSRLRVATRPTSINRVHDYDFKTALLVVWFVAA